MKIYIVRHGQTEWNRIDKVLGCETDMPLNETGIAQAHEAGRRIAAEGVKFDHIFSSPLSRARETAEIINSYQSAPCPITLVHDLREMTFGEFEGAQRDNPAYQASKREYFKRYKGGESFFEMAHRIYRFLDALRDGSAPGSEGLGPDSTVLIATHGGVVRILKNYFVDMENEEFSTFLLPNAEYLVFEL